MLALGLFTLGVGWNVAYLVASSMLAGGTDQARRQGTADGLAWSAGATASLASGVAFSTGGYALAGIGGALALVTMLLLWWRGAGATEAIPSPPQWAEP